MRWSNIAVLATTAIVIGDCGSYDGPATSFVTALATAPNTVTEIVKNDGRRHLVSGDFDGDGRLDNAYAATLSEDKWTLVVHFDVSNDNGGELVVVKQHTPDVPVDDIRLKTWPPGRYKTLCGVAPEGCEPGEPIEVVLLSDAILLLVLEASASLIYWDVGSREFTRHWLSD